MQCFQFPCWKIREQYEAVQRSKQLRIGAKQMFKSISDALGICLQGTIFSYRAKNTGKGRSCELWQYSMENADAPPYVITQEEYIVRHDLITKLHSVDNRLQEHRLEARRCRAKWLPDHHQQTYELPNPPAPNPQVELYYRTLGLNIARDPRTTWTAIKTVRTSS
jgi:hypothetical protein